MSTFDVNLIDAPDAREVYNRFKAYFQPIVRQHKPATAPNERFSWRPVPWDARAADVEPQSLARTMEAGVLRGRDMEKEIQYLMGELLFYITMADLWPCLEGSPKSLADWYKLRRISGNAPQHSEQTYGKYRRVYQHWFFELGDDAKTQQHLINARNTDVLEKYTQVAYGESASAWAHDATLESSKSAAEAKVRAAMTISTQQRIPLTKITPQMAMQHLQAQLEDGDDSGDGLRLHARELPAYLRHQSWDSDTPISITIEEETDAELLVRVTRLD